MYELEKRDNYTSIKVAKDRQIVPLKLQGISNP